MKQHLMRNINTISRCAALYRDAHLADCGLSGWQAPYIPEICAAPEEAGGAAAAPAEETAAEPGQGQTAPARDTETPQD